MTKLTFEDFPVGAQIDLPAKRVSAQEIKDFASQFDPAPFHLDEAAGSASMLGGLSASGWHVCAMAMRMMCDTFLLRSTSQGSPGIEECKWLKPVLAGDTLSGRIIALEARSSTSRPNLGFVKIRCELENQHGTKVFELTNTGMFLKREVA